FFFFFSVRSRHTVFSRYWSSDVCSTDLEMAAVLAPIMDKAATQAGLDRVAFRRTNAPRSDATIGPRQGGISSSYMPEAIDKAARSEERRVGDGRRRRWLHGD